MDIIKKIQDKRLDLQERTENPFQRAAVVTTADGEKRLFTGINSHKKAYQLCGQWPELFVKVEIYTRTFDRTCAVHNEE